MQTLPIGKYFPAYTLLCVEDNEDDFELIDHHLAIYKAAGLTMERCDSLETARSRLLRGGISIILLDLSLPDSEGVDTMKKMHLYAPEVPTIVLSGTTNFDVALESLKYGAEDYLPKNSVDAASLGRSLNFAMTRHIAREADGRLAAIVEASSDAIIGKTLSGTITSWNKGAEKLFGYSAAEATGKSIAIIIPPESTGELDEILTVLKNGDSIRNKETVRISKTGERIDVSATISPIVRPDGTITGAAAIDHDITDRKKTLRVLQESEERYRLLVSQVKDFAIFMLDANGLILSWNVGVKELKGYEAAEIIGKHFSVFYTIEDQKLGLPNSALKMAMAQGSHESQGWRVRKDCSRFFADVVITPVLGVDGALYGFTKVTRDITDRKLAEEEIANSRLRLSLALEAAAVGVWDFDLVKNSVWRSLRHDEIFGHKELLPDWNFDIFTSHVLAEDAASAKQAFQSGLEHGAFRLQCRIIRADDQAQRWISVRGENFRDEQGAVIRMMGTVADITDIKEKEEQQRLLAIMQEREDFMATLTHDMKNPLIAANRLLELFVEGSLGEISRRHHDMLQCLKESNYGLLTLIEDLLDVYRLEKDVSALEMANCDLVPPIVGCLSRIAAFADLRSIELINELPDKMLVRANVRSIERVVQNLLDNALKFTPDYGTIGVRLFSQSADTIIEIEDNGPGIALNEQSHLFKRFSQGAAGKRYSGGSGLGLYLCKQIVEAHGGTIECQSQPNKTTIFRVSLPKQASPKAVEPAE